MNVKPLAAAILGGVAMWLAAPAWAAPAAEPAMKAEAQDLVLKGDAKCTTCHDENDSPKALSIGKTRHGVGADRRTPTCTSCHGESATHQKDAGRGSGPTPPVDVSFSKRSTNSATEKNQACLTCHQGGKRVTWQENKHAARDVACVACHKVHAGHDQVRDKAEQADVCFACHKEQRAQVNRLSHHPLLEGKMGCSSCHDPHSGKPNSLIKSSTNETCYTCHMEKRGPFVHSHQPVTEDCAICHNPHGSNNESLLKARTPFLCQECHNDSSHRSQPGSLPNTRADQGTSNQGAIARGCLNCHTNIHGGNSTQSSSTAGRFRR